jgi:hypothetical protein
MLCKADHSGYEHRFAGLIGTDLRGYGSRLFYWLGSRRRDNRDVSQLNALVMDFALPASLFIATPSTPWDKIIALQPLLLAIGICMLAL